MRSEDAAASQRSATEVASQPRASDVSEVYASLMAENGGNGHDIGTSQVVPPKEVRDWLRARMSTIGKKGGKARQRAMTREERSEHARQAARKRWRKPRVEAG